MMANQYHPPLDERMLTAFHEAGHAVAYWHFGMRLRSVTCEPDQESLGAVSLDSAVAKYRDRLLRQMLKGQPLSPAMRFQAETRILVSLAGGLAETRRRGTPNHEGAGQDYENCVELAVRLCDGDSREAALFLAWLEYRAQKLIVNRWKEIVVVANALQDQGTLSGIEVECVLRKFHESEQR